jgi:hypothetical protein
MNDVKQMGLDCIELILKKLDKKISKDEYYLALMELHKKYPMPGHFPPLTVFQIKNYRKVKHEERIKQKVEDKKFGGLDMTFQDPKYDIVYEEHLQPLNFQEAAEMYIRHQQKLDDEFPDTNKYKKRTGDVLRQLKPKRPEVRDKKMESTGEHEEEVPF